MSFRSGFVIPLLLCARAVSAQSSAPFSEPPKLQNISKLPHTVEVNLTAAPTRLVLHGGKMSDVFAFNGMVPGPTLEIHEGDRVIVHFKNDLPQPTTIHWHGLHIPVTSDGSPLYLIQPGKSYDYVFTVPAGSAGTYWYHPHPHRETGLQIGKGMFGALIIRAAVDPLAGTPEKLMILTDQRFRPDGQIDFQPETTPQGAIDLENGREGNVMLVNGVENPTITIRSGEIQRWRVINASAARIYRLSIPGQKLVHVGTDGGLFEHPEEVDDIMLANSERAEFLVRGVGAPGSTTSVQSLPYDRYVFQTRPKNWKDTINLIQLRYTDEPAVQLAKIPSTLRVVPPLDTTKVTNRRTIAFMQGLIDGKMMDMARVDQRAKLGAMEIWEVVNLVGMDHPFHLHGFQFQVLDRNGVPEKVRKWSDSENVPKHQTLRFIVRFDDNPGKWMFHCHILDHEDHGMMGILEVK
jgi:bilirubin oxidase